MHLKLQTTNYKLKLQAFLEVQNGKFSTSRNQTKNSFLKSQINQNPAQKPKRYRPNQNPKKVGNH